MADEPNVTLEQLTEDLAALMDSSDTMTKALAPEGGEGATEGAKAPAGEGEATEAAGAAETTLGKSLGMVTLADGTEVEGFDASAIVVSLQTELDAQKATGAAMLKAMGTMATVQRQAHGLIQQQADLIKSLQADVQRIGGQGAGRKAVVNVHDLPKPGGGVTEPQGMNRGEALAKSMTLLGAGKLSAIDVAQIEGSLNATGKVPERYAPLFTSAA